MSLWYTLGIALGLAMHAFAVSVAAGIQITALNYKHGTRLALSFGLFQYMNVRGQARRSDRGLRDPLDSAALGIA
jgi:putative Mn2+ efflux pump MntP